MKKNEEQKDDVYHDYLDATNELLKEYALEAKSKYDSSKGTAENAFDSGYLMGFHRVISLLQQQADAFGIELEDIGLDDIDANRDLI